MSDPLEKVRVLNQRAAALTWRSVQLGLLVVVLSVLSLVFGMYNRPFFSSNVFIGIIVILIANQLRLAQGQLGRLTPAQPRAWMQPLAYGLYVVGGMVLAFSLFAAIRR